jgi:phage baseplate assembly protein W
MRTGVDERTGKLLTGWAHCVQSIGVILRTRIGSRPWAREFGAAVKDLQDQNATNRTLLEFARDTAIALENFEPGFRLSAFELLAAGRDGVFEFRLSGDFYPRGHLGDFSLKEDRDLTIAGNAGSLERLEAIA